MNSRQESPYFKPVSQPSWVSFFPNMFSIFFLEKIVITNLYIYMQSYMHKSPAFIANILFFMANLPLESKK